MKLDFKIIALFIFSLVNCAFLYSQTAEEYFYKGNEESEKGDYSNALADYTKSIELEPNAPSAYNNRANVYNLLKKYDDAVKDYSKAIELKPDLSSAFLEEEIRT